MKRITRDFFASSIAIAHSMPCHPEARLSPKDLPRCFRLKRRLHGFSTKNCRWLLAQCSVTTLAAPQSFAQGCANCYTTTAAGGTQTIHALRFGILILLIPPIVMFASLIWILWRWRSIKDQMESRR